MMKVNRGQQRYQQWAQLIVIAAWAFAIVVVSAASGSARRNLMQTVEERVLDPFERIRTCAPVNILVRAEPDPDAIRFRVLIEAGNENVVAALDTTVADGELLITFLEGDFITFRAIKVTVYAPPDALVGARVGGVAGDLVLVGFDLPDDFDIRQRPYRLGGRGDVIVLRRSSAERERLRREQLLAAVEEAAASGLFEPDGDELNTELRRQVIRRLVDELLEDDDDDSEGGRSEGGDPGGHANGAFGGFGSFGKGDAHAVVSHHEIPDGDLVWTCGLELVGDFVCSILGDDIPEILVTGRARSGQPDVTCGVIDPEELSMLPGLSPENPVPEVFYVREPLRSLSSGPYLEGP